ncbi:MAG TPA: hypothetical protein VF646_11325 [Cytophagales bacterium]|jgi:hypothetical protein
MNQPNAQSLNGSASLVPALPNVKSYLTLDTSTGELISKYKYLEGHPRQYRFDAKEGKFTLNGNEVVGSSFTFQPVAWRIFTDNILNLGTKNWAEIFFIDDRNCLSTLLFHGYSVDNIYRLIEPLYYEDLTLAHVVITATAERKENNKITPKGVYYIAQFSYRLAAPEKVKELQEFVADHKIYRQDTLTDLAQIKVAHGYYPITGGLNELDFLAEDSAA